MAVTASGYSRTVAVAVIPGGAVGAHEIPGDLDAADDVLISVVQDDGADPGTRADLTSEFSISDHNEITNTTTDTTGDFLIVTYAKDQAS